ncbi:hypothetical protein BN2364_0160 [Alloalcanivorax xenomutans]|nr:hypothetical protein BN2364_0160 [Alloalcanivorax xenomutans]
MGSRFFGLPRPVLGLESGNGSTASSRKSLGPVPGAGDG